jgi:diguanylate cyclase (GGDEF)-like protein
MTKAFHDAPFHAANPPPATWEKLKDLAGSIAIALFGLILGYRAVFLVAPSFLPLPSLLARTGCALALFLWGILTLVGVLRSKPLGFADWAQGEARCALILLWSVMGAVGDILAGAGPALFVFGVAIAASCGWSRIRRFILLEGAALGLVALATLLPTILGSGAPDLEELLVEAAAAGAGLAVTLAIKSIMLPNLEKVQSLERANDWLRDLSYKDQLTGLYNRRFAQETGHILLSRAIRYHEEFHVLLIDIDHFKRINDECSHAAGDEVLRGVAQTIQACIRAGDSGARYGGDEFLAFLVKAEGEMAQFIANRIREAISARHYPDVHVPVTVSIGIASYQNDDNLEALIERADKYLYVSKRAGRNRSSGY